MEQSILGWVAVGVVAGALFRWLVPRRDPGSVVTHVAIGVAGALLGGFVAQVAAPRVLSLGAAPSGAVLLLIVYRLVIARRQ